jgi:hypothetical protein
VQRAGRLLTPQLSHFSNTVALQCLQQNTVAGEATIKLHPFGDLDPIVDGAALFDGDDALFTDCLCGLVDEVSHMNVPVRGDGSNLGDLGCGGYGFDVGGEERGDAVNGGGPWGCSLLLRS